MVSVRLQVVVILRMEESAGAVHGYNLTFVHPVDHLMVDTASRSYQLLLTLVAKSLLRFGGKKNYSSGIFTISKINPAGD